MALTKATLIDLNSNELILDLDADTSITADTDDTIDFRIGGSDEVKMTSAAISPATADGNALGTAALEWSDLFLADAAVISLGADQDVTLTHVHNTGLLLNSTMALQFNDASQYINAPSATVLDINATDEIELNATLVDINANVEISGTATTTGVHTFTAVPVFPNNTVETADIQADAITGAKIADDAIDSEHYTDGSIDIAHLADDAVTLAKMASGTDGNLISYDTSGNPVAVATGTDGQVLTSAGAGQVCLFEDAAGGGSHQAAHQEHSGAGGLDRRFRPQPTGGQGDHQPRQGGSVWIARPRDRQHRPDGVQRQESLRLPGRPGRIRHRGATRPELPENRH